MPATGLPEIHVHASCMNTAQVCSSAPNRRTITQIVMASQPLAKMTATAGHHRAAAGAPFTEVLKDHVTTTWKDIFYPDGVATTVHADYKAIADERARTVETENQAQDRQAHCEARGVPDTFDMLMALPYIMVPQEHLKATIRETQEKADAAEQRRVQERVETWMEQITTA